MGSTDVDVDERLQLAADRQRSQVDDTWTTGQHSQSLDDSSGVIGQDLRELMSLYARACCLAPPPPSSLAPWLVGLVWDGPGWPEVTLADFAPALGPKGLSRVGDLVTERVTQRAAEHAVGAAPDRWRDQWAAQHLRSMKTVTASGVPAKQHRVRQGGNRRIDQLAG